MADPASWFSRIDRLLSRLPRGLQVALVLLLLAVCAGADYLTGAEVSFSITYLGPIALATWYLGASAGFGLAVLAALGWHWVGALSGLTFSHPLIPLWNALVRLGFFLIVTTLLLQVRRLIDQLRGLSETDALTGLANTRLFFRQVEQERQRALRYGHPFAVAYLDLDNFKEVNDRWGHEVGDRVLRAIAEVLTSNLRSTDLPARLGGDEFALLLVETGETEATEALGKLHARLLEAMARGGWPVGCSLGAVVCRSPGSAGVDELIRQADALMYQVKQAGKNRFELRVLVPEG